MTCQRPVDGLSGPVCGPLGPFIGPPWSVSGLSVDCQWPVKRSQLLVRTYLDLSVACHRPIIGLSGPVCGLSGPVRGLSDLSMACQVLLVACHGPGKADRSVLLTVAWFSHVLSAHQCPIRPCLWPVRACQRPVRACQRPVKAC